MIAWQAIALTTLGHVVAYLFSDDFHLTLWRLAAIVGSWVGILFVVWLVASVFDRYAGFERWFKAFALREKAGVVPAGGHQPRWDPDQSKNQRVSVPDGYAQYYDRNGRPIRPNDRGVNVRFVDTNRDGYILRREASEFVREVQREGLDRYFERRERDSRYR